MVLAARPEDAPQDGGMGNSSCRRRVPIVDVEHPSEWSGSTLSDGALTRRTTNRISEAIASSLLPDQLCLAATNADLLGRK